MQTRKKRVLWVTFDFPPRLSSGVFRPIKIYKYLDKSRFEVDFVTQAPRLRFRDAAVDDSLLAEVHPTPRIYKVPAPILHDLVPALAARLRRKTSTPVATDASHRRAELTGGNRSQPAGRESAGSALYRRFAMCLYFPDHLFIWGWMAAFTSLWLHLRNRYDLVYTTSYPESAHLPGLVLSWLGVKWVADYRYGGPLWVKKLVGYRKSPFRERIDQRYQGLVLRAADCVIAQSEHIRADFCSIFALDPSRVRVIPSGYDEQDFDKSGIPSAPFPKHDNEVHLLHVGAMEGVGDRERRQLVDALNRLDEGLGESGRKLVLHTVGKDLFGEEQKRGAAQFDYRPHGVIVHRDLLAYLLAADCLLLSTITTSTGHGDVRGFIPGKLWEYLRACRPILMVGPQDEVWTIIEEAGVGLHMGLNGEGPLSADRLIGRLHAKKHLHPNIRNYSWESRAHSLQDAFLHLVGTRDAAPHPGETLA